MVAPLAGVELTGGRAGESNDEGRAEEAGEDMEDFEVR